MLKKYYSDDSCNLCVIYEAQNGDNARTFGIWLIYDKLRKVYSTNDFTIVRMWH